MHKKLQERHQRYYSCRWAYWEITVTKWHLWPSCRHPNHHRYMSQVSQQHRQYWTFISGDMSTGFGQSCSWAMPMRSKTEGKKGREHIWNKELGYRKGSRGPEASGWFFADHGREKKEIYCCCCGGTPYTLFLLAIPAMLSPSRIMLCLAAEAALAIPGFCCSKAGSG